MKDLSVRKMLPLKPISNEIKQWKFSEIKQFQMK